MEEFFPSGTKLQGRGEQAQGGFRVGKGDLQPAIRYQPAAIPAGVQRTGKEQESLEEQNATGLEG